VVALVGPWGSRLFFSHRASIRRDRSRGHARFAPSPWPWRRASGAATRTTRSSQHCRAGHACPKPSPSGYIAARLPLAVTGCRGSRARSCIGSRPGIPVSLAHVDSRRGRCAAREIRRAAFDSSYPLEGWQDTLSDQPASRPRGVLLARGGPPHHSPSRWPANRWHGHRAQPWLKLVFRFPANHQTGRRCEPNCPQVTTSLSYFVTIFRCRPRSSRRAARSPGCLSRAIGRLPALSIPSSPPPPRRRPFCPTACTRSPGPARAALHNR